MNFKLILIMGLLAAVSCSSQRDIHRADSSQTQEIDTSLTDGRSNRRLDQWWWMAAGCDSLRLSLRADSVVRPDGTVIHNPSAESTVAAPRLAATDSAHATATDSLHAVSTHSKDTSSSAALTDTRDDTAVASPKLGWSTMAMSVMIFFVLWWLRKSASRDG
ncbi:MAG: hypothetical protein NC411_10315 [Bacteroides sp.]|nr:hypothetical protein [Bacteroides sp.]